MAGLLQSIGNPLTGYELGSGFGSQFLVVNAVPGTAAVFDFKHVNNVVIQWRTTGSMSGSVLAGNDASNLKLLNTINMPGAQIQFVALDANGNNGSFLPRYLQFVIGSATSATVTGSGFCDVFARMQ
ncbi:MAG: hypothetical protein Q8O88_01470 [bacterium]|nr:hypothetical protein [bacterium]